MAKNFIKRLGGDYDLESRGSAFPCTVSQDQETTRQLRKHLQMWHYACFKVDGVSCVTSPRSYTCYLLTVYFFSSIVLLLHRRIKWYSRGTAYLETCA